MSAGAYWLGSSRRGTDEVTRASYGSRASGQVLGATDHGRLGEPLRERVERVRPAQEVRHEVGGVVAAARREDLVAVARRDRGVEQIGRVERGEHVLGDDEA